MYTTPTNPQGPQGSRRPANGQDATSFPPPPPGQPASYSGQPAPAHSAARTAPSRDQIIMMGAGAVAFIASFMPWLSVSLGFVSGTGNAWQSGLPAWASMLVCVAVAAAVAANTFLGIKLPPVGSFAAANLLIAGAGLALALVVLRAIWLPSIQGVSITLSFGFFIALIASLAQVIAAVRYRAAQQAGR